MGEKLDKILEELSTIEAKFESVARALKVVEANSRLVVAQVEEHGGMLANLERRLMRVSVHCPLMTQDGIAPLSVDLVRDR